MPRALVRAPTASLAREATLTFLSRQGANPDLLALQHRAYGEALRDGGFQVLELPVLPGHPDATFVEDLGVAFRETFVWGRSAAPARVSEVAETRRQLRVTRPGGPRGWEPPFQAGEHVIATPGTLEGGDVLTVGRTVLVGLSPRTNPEGLRQLTQILAPLGYEVRPVRVAGALHLKTGCTALDPETLLVNPDWVALPDLAGFRFLSVEPREPFAANALPLPSGALLVPASAPATRDRLEAAGWTTVGVDISEFEKAEGGLTCLSLRLP